VEAAVPSGNQKPEWLESFLGKTFFDDCLAHPIRKNELNKYCINCNKSACQYCMASGAHRLHRILKIYRHVYRDVVSLAAMEKYIDCSQIQPYRCNKRLVISLSPLPHSGPISNIGAACCSVFKEGQRLRSSISYRPEYRQGQAEEGSVT
ncbi:PLATZ transcription factor family protein, partial [Prunus dulcis]